MSKPYLLSADDFRVLANCLGFNPKTIKRRIQSDAATRGKLILDAANNKAHLLVNEFVGLLHQGSISEWQRLEGQASSDAGMWKRRAQTAESQYVAHLAKKDAELLTMSMTIDNLKTELELAKTDANCRAVSAVREGMEAQLHLAKSEAESARQRLARRQYAVEKLEDQVDKSLSKIQSLTQHLAACTREAQEQRESANEYRDILGRIAEAFGIEDTFAEQIEATLISVAGLTSLRGRINVLNSGGSMQVEVVPIPLKEHERPSMWLPSLVNESVHAAGMLSHILDCFNPAQFVESVQSPLTGQISGRTFNEARKLSETEGPRCPRCRDTHVLRVTSTLLDGGEWIACSCCQLPDFDKLYSRLVMKGLRADGVQYNFHTDPYNVSTNDLEGYSRAFYAQQMPIPSSLVGELSAPIKHYEMPLSPDLFNENWMFGTWMFDAGKAGMIALPANRDADRSPGFVAQKLGVTGALQNPGVSASKLFATLKEESPTLPLSTLPDYFTTVTTVLGNEKFPRNPEGTLDEYLKQWRLDMVETMKNLKSGQLRHGEAFDDGGAFTPPTV